MKLEQQVVSLPLAKRLKELGVKQESYFVWADDSTGDRIFMQLAWLAFLESEEEHAKEYECFAAFTVAELGEMLPQYIGDGLSISGYLQMSKNSDGWHVRYHAMHVFNTETEADARAKMLIYLLENNLLPTPSMKVD